MTNLTTSQVEEILLRYKATAHLNRAKALLEMNAKKRRWILRAHYRPRPDGAPVTDADEIAARDNCDAVLELASVLEVIAIATGGSFELPARMASRLRDLLGDEHVRAYYCNHYPLALPELFRLRLASGLPRSYIEAIQAENNSEDPAYTSPLISFFALDARRVHNKDLALFLDLIDDYTSPDGEVDLSDTLELLKDAKSFEKRILKPRGGTAVERQALRGLNDFIRFATDYDELLRRIENKPLMRSAFWLHNCYWFGVGGGSVHFTAERLRRQLTKWTDAEVDAADEDVSGLKQRVDEVLVVLARMTDWQEWAKSIGIAARPHLEHWKKAVASEKSRRRKS